jgi:hydroxyquinol 1,2-dioxygenase
MAAVTDDNITEEVCARYARAPDPRLAQVMTSLVRHLHAFARDVHLTRAEWLAALEFLIAAGKKSDPKRNEMMLVSDVLGLSMLTVMLDQAGPEGATPNTIEGPFFIPDSPVLDLGGDMRADAPGKLCYMHGRVVDMHGQPIEGVRLDVWQADDDGLYEAQLGKETGYLRATYVTGPDGHYCAKTVVPKHYSIPLDGPVGELVAATGISHDRPAHIHVMAQAAGYELLVTHLFRAGAEYLDQDAVYGVRPELIVDFHDHAPGPTPSGEVATEPYSTVLFDIVLAPAKSRAAREAVVPEPCST